MGGNEPEDDEPDKMKIAFQRISRFKAYVKNLLNPKNIIKRLKRRKVGDIKPLNVNGNGTMNGHIEKNGIPFDSNSVKLENGIHQGKEDMLNNFQKQIGQDMDLTIPYNDTKTDTITAVRHYNFSFVYLFVYIFVYRRMIMNNIQKNSFMKKFIITLQMKS